MLNLHIHLLLIVLCSLLRGAEQIGMYKQVKSQYGGGIRRFSCEEDTIYENIESELCFFTSQVSLCYGILPECDSSSCEVQSLFAIFLYFLFCQERQTIIKYWLDNLRARQGDVLHNIHFLEGQPISMYLLAVCCKLFSCYSIFWFFRLWLKHAQAKLEMTLRAKPHTFRSK